MLSEKIMNLRKEKGWSQEQLAEKLEVSRQAVSKWESGASVPDLDKIIKISNLFEVSTDYLLKEGDLVKESQRPIEKDRYDAFDMGSFEKEAMDSKKMIFVDEAEAYLNDVKHFSIKMALGVSMCIFSPITMILLAGVSELMNAPISENMAAGIGMTVLLVLVAAAVAIFIINGMKMSKYNYIEEEIIDLESAAMHRIQSEKENFMPKFQQGIAAGTVLCILGIVPLFIGLAFTESDFVAVCSVSLLLCFASIGVHLLVRYGCVNDAFCKLLQEGDYTIENKQMNKHTSAFSSVYWCTVTAMYLAWSFSTGRWEHTWIIWPVAGVLYAGIKGVFQMGMRSKN